VGEGKIPPESLARLKALDDACATGRPRGERQISKRRKRADQVKIAAGLGSGAAIREVAEDTGLSKTMVMHVKKKIESGKDKHLVAVAERARQELATQAIDVLKLNIEKQKEALEKTGKDAPRLSDMAQSARALNEIAFAPSIEEAKQDGFELGANVTGKIAAELLLKLKEHEARTSRPERLTEGERVD
jgi:hypothetical protein